MNNKIKPLNFENKKARFNYIVKDEYEAGIELNGLEIKAIRANKLNLTGSYAKIISGEAFWLGGEIGVTEGDRQRTRRLLLKRSEIDKIFGILSQEKASMFPLRVYIKRGRAKMLLGIGRGKKTHDKRETIKARDIERENARLSKIS